MMQIKAEFKIDSGKGLPPIQAPVQYRRLDDVLEEIDFSTGREPVVVEQSLPLLPR